MVQLLDGTKTAKKKTGPKKTKKNRLPADSGGWADGRLSFVNHQCLCLGANDEKDAFLERCGVCSIVKGSAIAAGDLAAPPSIV
jgi:hypothetical protein